MAGDFKILGFKSLFLAGLAAVALGYVVLQQGSMTVAPVLLVAGYCLLIPSALFRLGHSDAARPRNQESGRGRRGE